jgi:hypothetical protein
MLSHEAFPSEEPFLSLALPKRGRHVVTVSTRAIERKLVELARRVAALEAKTGGKRAESWRGAVGEMKDSDLFEEALRLGAKWRARANVNGR